MRLGALGVAAIAFASLANAATLTRGPYLQRLGARGVTVVWRTDVPAPCAVELRPPRGGSRKIVEGARETTCAVTVDGLEPGTSYGYVPLADDAPLTEASTFKTDDPAAPFSFLVLGDSGCGCAGQEAVRDRMVETPADLVLHTGDMVYEEGAATEYDAKFFTPYAPLLRRLVLWPTLGNHDMRTAHGQPWRDAFWIPADNPARSESYYSFDHGNAHFVVLNSSESLAPGSAQRDFLNADLGATTARWKFVAFHHTIYSSGYHGSNLVVRSNIVPVLDARRVDVVFMGHDHDYERTYPLREDRIVGPGVGTVYVTTGGGGNHLRPVASGSFTAYAESTLHFVHVSVDGPHLVAEMVRPDGSIGDTFRLTRN